jgi:hypothetical protein
MTRKLLSLAVCMVFSVVAVAQNATTSVRGTVTDSTGAVLQSATVTLTNMTTQVIQKQTAGKNGDYNFVELQPATYRISVDASGFGTQEKQVELLVSQPATIGFKMTVGSTAQAVEVTASSTINFSDATIGNAINNAQIETMPIDSRNVADLLSLQPGVLYFNNNNGASNPAATQDSRLGAVAGARSDQGNITLDGLDNNDQTFGYAFTGVLRTTIDSTEEYRVVTASGNADSGRSSGAQVTLVTKSGTNQFHGSAYEYFRNRYFAANDWFIKKAQAQTGAANKPGQLTRNTFGGTVGGPIWKDKLFFFFNYEGQRTRESASVTQEVPTAPYAKGILQYKDTSGNVRTLTQSQVATLDAPCTANGVCPLGPGPNAAILAYFAQVPVANGLTIGDGLNEGSYTFSSPTPYSHNTSIIKLDWTPGPSHRVFVRGNLQKDVSASTQQFPGLPPSTTTEDNTKGIAAGDTWTVNSRLVNDIRYSYSRQAFAQAGVGSGVYTDIRFIASPTAETRSTIRSVPLNTILDTLNYTKGNHSIQVGGTWRLIHNNSQTNANSFNNGNTNPLGLSSKGLPDPSTLPGYTPVAGSFSTNYLEAYANLVGTTPVLTQNINYAVNPGGKTGSLSPQGAYVARNFISNEFEGFAQDSWRATPSLTITLGLRYSNLQVPYDKNGQSAAPTIDTHAFFEQRGTAAAAGQVYEPAIAFAPNGPVYGRPGYWAKQKTNFAPRLAIAYALDSKTSVRAGFGMYYDHFGQGIVNAFNSYGSFGLASQLSSALGALTTENSPRFTSRNTLPNVPGTTPAETQTFPYVLPQTYPASSFGISWGVDNRIKTPYSEVFNVSVERALPGGFVLEASYVGRVGRKLMQQLDLATPVNLLDPKSGMTYFQAGAKLAALVDQNGGNAKATVPSIPYFENLFPQLATGGLSATQNIYTKEFATFRKVLGETTALADLDFYCSYGCPASAPTNRFFQGQFSSLYAWSTIGTSSYNAGQFVLRHRLNHGFQGDLSYTLGNSIDLGSDAERSSEKQGGSGSYITNAWNPEQSRGVSDFDVRHSITGNGSYLLPLGHGQAFGTHVNRLTDLAIGGWRFASILRWTSGLPFSLTEGGFTTDWEIASYGVQTGKFKAKKVYMTGNVPNAFGSTLASQITGSITNGGPLERLPYPGEAGQRNNFRRDGNFGVDASLTKPFKITEKQLIRFTWEVFNVSNSVRFNAVSGSLVSGTFGNYSSTLTTSRRMQLSLRYSF